MANNAPMNPDKLTPGEIIIRICPITKHPVLTKYLGNEEVICLHQENPEQDFQRALEYLNQTKFNPIK